MASGFSYEVSAGPGSALSRGAGCRITLADGCSRRFMAGCGCPADLDSVDSAIGGRPQRFLFEAVTVWWVGCRSIRPMRACALPPFWVRDGLRVLPVAAPSFARPTQALANI